MKIFFTRLFHWEYWNSFFIYAPLMPWLIWLWIKARNVFFFAEVNPGLENGGFIMESKWKIHNDFYGRHFPETLFFDKTINQEELVRQVNNKFSFPVIAKPDIGGKGRGVARIRNNRELVDYFLWCPHGFIVQENIEFPMEAGIFYVRFPGEESGKITGITLKQFITVTGDGVSTVRDLLEQNPRYLMQLSALSKILTLQELNEVLEMGTEKVISSIGNHARGALFTDASGKVSPALELAINKICGQFNGFFFGRLDIRFASWEELERGESFSIIEVNGSGSEPTHIYDPVSTLFNAWITILQHWNDMCKISIINREMGAKGLSFKNGLGIFVAHRRFNRKMKKFVLMYPGKNERDEFASIVLNEQVV